MILNLWRGSCNSCDDPEALTRILHLLWGFWCSDEDLAPLVRILKLWRGLAPLVRILKLSWGSCTSWEDPEALVRILHLLWWSWSSDEDLATFVMILKLLWGSCSSYEDSEDLIRIFRLREYTEILMMNLKLYNEDPETQMGSWNFKDDLETL